MAFGYRNPITVNPVGAITRVVNLLDTGALEGGWSKDGARTYSFNLRVETDSRYVGPIQIIRSLNVNLGSYYQFPVVEYNGDGSTPAGVESDKSSFLVNIRARREADDAKSWLVALDFAQNDLIHELGDEQVADGSFNPLQRRPEVSWGSVKYQFSKSKDLDGKPFVNTAGEPLQDPPLFDENRPLLTIVMNREKFDPLWVNQFKDSVNADVFLDFPPNKVKCKDITGDQEWDADWGMFWRVKHEFEIKDDSDTDDDGYTVVLVNAGYREKTSPSATPTEVMLGGKPVSEPVLLDVNGKYVPGGDPHYLEFHTLPEKNFADLNIPEDILTRTT